MARSEQNWENQSTVFQQKHSYQYPPDSQKHQCGSHGTQPIDEILGAKTLKKIAYTLDADWGKL